MPCIAIAEIYTITGEGSIKARIAMAGIYTIAGKESREFPKDCLKVANLRVLSLDQCDLQEVHLCKAQCVRP